MNYRKLQNTRLTNRLLEERYFNTKFINEDVKFTLGVDNKIIKTDSDNQGKPTDLSQEENNYISSQNANTPEEYKKLIDNLNTKFSKNI